MGCGNRLDIPDGVSDSAWRRRICKMVKEKEAKRKSM